MDCFARPLNLTLFRQAMIQVILHVNNKKKWNILKLILDVVNIQYDMLDSMRKVNEKELELIRHAENDKENRMVCTYTSHCDILRK